MSQGEPIAEGDKVLKKRDFIRRDFLLNSNDVKRAFTPGDTLVLCGTEGRTQRPTWRKPEPFHVLQSV